MILETIADKYLWFLIAILVVNMYQRKGGARSYRKRTATLIIASLAMVWQVFIVIILSRGWPHWLAIPALALALAIGIPFRKRILLFRGTCVQCSAKLAVTAIINHDDNLCDSCWAKEHPEQAAPKEAEKIVGETVAQPTDARNVDDIDWDSWEPTETAVLCYLFDKDRVLLIDKKTGLGKGLVNAPGGHLEEAETASEAAMREIAEETGISVPSVTYMGKLEFQFTDGLAMRGHVFFAHEHSGTLTETDEARPFWCEVKDLPYDRMWEDDKLWLPIALEGKRFSGRFVFEGEKMLSHQVTEESDET
ncbi:MAG: 8-oxo-dGTP diphosphatase [Sphaerochaetaceae bacterium]|jgi:8-oxo-dGTP diphosphatase|nr:8-oxo-dGTP diphosphatase [Sphaerochaetaceae bacterium]MDX9940080.1 8-oxo-dGTP diphosphatase [Sphaerochaetaceae bacterium]